MERRNDLNVCVKRGSCVVKRTISFVFCVVAIVFCWRMLSDYSVSEAREEYAFLYEGDNYRYVITVDYQEIISIKDGTEYVDILNGAGTYHVYSDYRTVAESKGIESYTVSEENEEVVVTVSYEMSDGSQAINKYYMHNKYMRVEYTITGVSQEQYITHAILDRNFLSSYVASDKKTSDYWVFPANNDFPYKEADSIVDSFYFANNYSMHSFLRGDDGKELVFFEYMKEEDYLIKVNSGVFSAKTIVYDYVFENATTKEEADYLALFKSRGNTFATRIQAVTTAYGNSTLFYTDCVDFLIDVTNLEACDMVYTVEYNVYDYTGNVYMAQNREIDLAANEAVSIPIQISSKQNGIYYIDMSVTDGVTTHRELYSFALMEEYERQYSDTNPFGISGVRFGEYEPNTDTIQLLDALGASNVRVCISHPDYLMDDYTLLANCLQQLVNNKIRVNGQYLLMKNWVVPTKENADAYSQEIYETLNVVNKYLSNCESGNEFNLAHTASSMEVLVQDYMDRYYDPSYKTISGEYGLDTIAGAVGMSRTDWMEQMVESGLYDRTTILTTHTYGYPYSPDILAKPEVESVVESALVRTKQFMDSYEDKKWCLNEIGYPTTALMTTGMWSGVDLRTQADYIIRVNILGMKYGADEIETYCLYDQHNLRKGVSPANIEMNFGLFYYEDYFGRIMPKPSAIAFSNMTYMLDGVQNCEEIEMSSSTIRAFEMQMADEQEQVIVAWSNCARLTNDRYLNLIRTPCLPWQNQWKSTESATFLVDGNYAEVIDSMGNSKELPVEDHMVQVELSGAPCYIVIKK